jgi:poly(U)-binding-splicing factor PUF60
MTDTDGKRGLADAVEEGTERKRTRKRASGWDKVEEGTAVPAPSTVGANVLLPASAALATLQQQVALQQLIQQQQVQQQMRALLVQQQLQQQVAQAAQAGLLQSVNNAASNPMNRRVYVGSLEYTLTEEHIRVPFSAFGTISKIDMPREPGTNRSKGFCFVEYSTEESAQAAMRSMNGFLLSGRPIKVNLPTSVGTATASTPLLQGGLLGNLGLGGVGLLSSQQPVLNPFTGLLNPINTTATATLMAMKPAGAAPLATSSTSQTSTYVAPAPSPRSNRVYVGCVYWDLTSEHLKAVFEAFGTVVSCELIPDPDSGKHKGYGYLEFRDEASASNAIENMDGFELCNKKLKVGFCHPSSTIPPTVVALSVPPPTAAQLAARVAAAVAGHPIPFSAASSSSSSSSSSESLPDQGGSITSVEREDDLRVSGASQRQQLMQKLSRSMDSSNAVNSSVEKDARCLILRNMVGPGEVDPDLKDEVQEECRKFGAVSKVVIHETKQAVNIYVLFETDNAALSAKNSLDNRFFGGRTVQATFYPRAKFEMGVYL